MSTSVVLPALGESVTEGTVTRWLKQVGDTVQADEGLLEISTDKVDTEIPSPVSGVIEEILVTRLRLIAEVRVRVKRSVRRDRRKVRLRREELNVERRPAAASSRNAGVEPD